MSDRKSYGIIGHGFVGKAQARVWMEHGEVRIHDAVKERSPNTLEEVAECDFIFICVPTLPKDREGGDWSVDLSAVEDVLIRLAATGTEHIVVIKSTVPVGTTKALSVKYPALKIIHSPEFLTARCALIDAQTPSRNIVGFPNADGLTYVYRLKMVLDERFPGVPCLTMQSGASELVKLACNGFFAAKVIWFNEMYMMAQKSGLNWDSVREGMLSDGRIAHAHTNVPGPDRKTGFGGTCFPKDLQDLIHCMTEKKSPRILAEAVWAANQQYREPTRDMLGM